MRNFYEWFLEQDSNKIFQIPNHFAEWLAFNYSPNVQFQSGHLRFLEELENFKKTFSNGRPSYQKLISYIDPEYGAKMVAYSNGKVFIGKARVHAELMEKDKVADLEGYFNPSPRMISVSHLNTDAFYQIKVWHKMLKNLLDVDLIDINWRVELFISGVFHPSSVKSLLSQKEDINPQDNSQLNRKEKEAENLVQNFKIQQSINNKSADPVGYLYRYGESC